MKLSIAIYFDEFITKLNGLLSGVTLKPGECIKMGDVLFEQGGYNIEIKLALPVMH